MLPVARAIQHGRVSKLRRHVAICRRGNILKTFLMKMGESSSLVTKTLISRRIIKNNALLEKFRRPGAREKREEGDRRSGLSVTSKICLRRNLLLTSGSLYLSEETNKA